MHTTKHPYLMQIEPRHGKSELPVEDEFTFIMEELLTDGTNGVYQDGKFILGDNWRGCHVCICGERSGCSDIKVGSGHITNSLAAHYLRWHREDVPQLEFYKIRNIHPMVYGLSAQK